MVSADVVTLDGPAGVGKSTLAKAVAKTLGYGYLDTGAMYRALALKLGRDAESLPDEVLRRRCAEHSFRLEGTGADTVLYCDGEPADHKIRTEEVGVLASRIAARQVIRDAMKAAQRDVASHGPLVAEGRDMGTVVFPEASRKVFLDARPEVRALRRYRELTMKGGEADLERVTAQIRARDHADRTRAAAPLRPADDAVIIDTSDLTLDGVLNAILEVVRP